MKITLRVIVFIVTLNIYGQNKITLNANIGINYSNLSVLEYHKNEKIKYNGIGNTIDVKLGVPLKENMLINLGFSSSSMSNVNSSRESSLEKSKQFIIYENSFLTGLTYYTKKRFSLTSNIGMGYLMFLNMNENEFNGYRTDNGISFQLKFGKEWTLFNNWYWGTAISYRKSYVKDSNLKIQTNNISAELSLNFR